MVMMMGLSHGSCGDDDDDEGNDDDGRPRGNNDDGDVGDDDAFFSSCFGSFLTDHGPPRPKGSAVSRIKLKKQESSVHATPRTRRIHVCRHVHSTTHKTYTCM